MPRAICYLSPTARHVLIAANPTAGSGANRSAVAELLENLAANGLQGEVTSDLDYVAQRGADPAANGLRAVVAAGGDGTAMAVVNRVHPDTPLAVLPLGTENLLAKYMHTLVSPAELGQMIAHGATVRMDAGQAGDRVFLLMAGCGFDADVVHRLHSHRTGHIQHLTYVKPILDSIRRYQYPLLRVHCEGVVTPHAAAEAPPTERSFSARWLFVVNLPRYAGGLRLVPQAVGSDGRLDVCGFEKGSLASGLRYLTGIVRGQHLNWPDCHYLQATKVRIEADDEVHYQLDGDPGGKLPVEIKILPERVRLVVTETWAMKRGFRHTPT